VLASALTLLAQENEPPLLEINLSVVVFMPLAAGLIGALLPARFARWPVLLGALGVLAYAAVMIVDYEPGLRELQYDTYADWIPQLGVSYALGLDGLNLFLVALTALLWSAATLVAAVRVPERPRLFFFHLALAETAVLGAFCAQDLVLFILFFDLMLVPFYFLIGGWGGEGRVRATTKFVIYTLVGSLLMLAGTVALGVLSVGPGQELSFLLADLDQRSVGTTAQAWIFVAFAAAFLVKMPLFPLHGWMPDAYRATPIPVLVLLSAVLSKVGAYGFLRVVLPLLPDGVAMFQEIVIALAVVSILYGSVVAYAQDDVRLVVGYSSVAQLGFITLGIFSLDPRGAQGAVLQMVTHGLVVAPLFFVIAALAARAHGSDWLPRMGGIATRAPVLATLFVIVAFATLAMPGSPNFVGELLILFGALETHLVFGLVASLGVVLAAVYMIRAFQRAMHGPLGRDVESRELSALDLAAVAPLAAVIVALGVFPQLVLGRTEGATVSRIAKAARAAGTDARPAQARTPGGEPAGEWRYLDPGRPTS
jgi:NADH-quinone oxidoreductase subunit M